MCPQNGWTTRHWCFVVRETIPLQSFMRGGGQEKAAAQGVKMLLQ